LRALGVSTIAGIDEAGRGALAGPVVAAAVVLPEKFRHRKLNDSKQLLPERREEIYHELLDDEALAGKALKVISMLLPSLPKKHRYRLVFMTRPIEEVVASQARMIERRGTGEAQSDPASLSAELQAHRERVLGMIKQNPSMEVLEIDFPALIRAPQQEIARLRAFLGEDNLPNADAMEAVIRPDLHRQKG